MNARRVASLAFHTLLFVLVFLPSGTLVGFHVKAFAFVIFAAAFLVYIIGDRSSLSIRHILFAVLVITFLLFLTFISLVRGNADTVDIFGELGDIATTIVVSALGLLLVRNRVIKAESIIMTVVYAMCGLSLMKFGFAAALYSLGLQGFDVMDAVFGQAAATIDLVPLYLDLLLPRIMFPAYILLPLAMFAVLAPSISGMRPGKMVKGVLVVMLLLSAILAYSRYNWMLCVVALIVAAIIENVRKSSIIVALVVLASLFSFNEVLMAVAQARFASNSSTVSDEIRSEQFKQLAAAFEDHPLLGIGLGGHVQIIRSFTRTYSYELQWVALLMQVGIVGMAGILLLIFAAANDLFAARHRGRGWLLLLFLLYLGAAFTNPNLTTSYAGGAFLLFMMFFHRMRTLGYDRVQSAISPILAEGFAPQHNSYGLDP